MMSDYQPIPFSELKPGMSAIWLYTNQRGWSPTVPVKAKVIAITRVLVEIEVEQKIDGEWKTVKRLVGPENLYFPKAAKS